MEPFSDRGSIPLISTIDSKRDIQPRMSLLLSFYRPVEMRGIEGDRAKAQAREEPQVKTLRWSVLRESVDQTWSRR